MRLLRADANGAIVREVPIALGATTIVHDCLLTEHSFVLVVAPLIFDLQAIMRGKPAFRFEPERGTEIIIIDRIDTTRPPQRIMTAGFYFWHFLNGFENAATLTSIWSNTRRSKVRSTFTARNRRSFGSRSTGVPEPVVSIGATSASSNFHAFPSR